MNYTSSRYDGPYGYLATAVGVNGAAGRHPVANGSGSGASTTNDAHSASSSLGSASEGRVPALQQSQQLGQQLLNGSQNGYIQHTKYQNSSTQPPLSLHHFDNPSDFDRPSAGSGGMSRLGARTGAGVAPIVTNYQQQHHKRAQQSDEYDKMNGYLGPPSAKSTMGNNGDFDEKDASFDFLLSPGLAPVGPISTSSSQAHSSSYASVPAPPLPNHPPPTLPSDSSYISLASGSQPGGYSTRPILNRSQTAGPVPNPSDRTYAANPVLAFHQHFHGQAQQNSATLEGGPSSLQANHAGIQHPAPPAISASALLDVVLRMRSGVDPAPPLTPSASTSSSMARSQSANVAPRPQQMTAQSSHARNVSTGSNKSDEDSNLAERSAVRGQPAGGLLPPQHPGLSRTASSKNIIPNGLTGLETVDLSHQRVSEVTDDVIHVLSGTVERLALSYNYIATLPSAFSKLGSTLRYLNIRLNMLTIFPPVLCEMPSLEILDISRNKIKRLPAHCGTLKNLRVFSISKNRVKRLPIYFADMSMLRVLKIDHNPLEWPPRDIVTQPTMPANKLDEAQALGRWLSNLQEWIKDHADEAPPSIPPLLTSKSEDTLSSTGTGDRLRPTEAIESLESSLRTVPSLASLAPSVASYLAEGEIFPSVSTIAPLPRINSKDLPALDMDAARMSQHGRNASHSLASGPTQIRGLRSKKSLPDLRQNHAQILDERFQDSDTGSGYSEQRLPVSKSRPTGKHYKTSSNSSLTSASPSAARPPTVPTPLRSASGEKASPFPNFAMVPPSTISKDVDEPDDLAPLRGDQLLNQRRNPNRRGNINHNTPSGLERGSSGAYFRRLSMLPASTISKAVPSALLAFIDGIRGILFSLSQIYSSLKQFVVFPAPDRLPTVLVKMMASADDAMGFLIDALDRFDASSRRKSPEQAIVKEVIETCRENVAIFGKLVLILSSQSKTLFGANADLRYTRTLVLALWGAMGEIVTSWTALTALKADVITWLRGDVELSQAHLQLQSSSPLAGSLASDPSLPVTNLSAFQTRPAVTPTLTSFSKPVQKQRPVGVAIARRHAGSFTGYNAHFAS